MVLRHLNARRQCHLQIVQYLAKVEERLEVEESALRGGLDLEFARVEIVEHVLEVSLLHSMSIVIPLVQLCIGLNLEVFYILRIEYVVLVAHAHLDVNPVLLHAVQVHST